MQIWRRTSVTLQETRSRFANFWREGHREARIDLSANWRRDLKCFLVFVWFACLSSSFGILYAIFMSGEYFNDTACQPDGSFELDPEKFRYWKSGFFQISLGFGNLSFTKAKAIDIIWDVVGA